MAAENKQKEQKLNDEEKGILIKAIKELTEKQHRHAIENIEKLNEDCKAKVDSMSLSDPK